MSGHLTQSDWLEIGAGSCNFNIAGYFVPPPPPPSAYQADAYEPNDVWQDAVHLKTDGLDVALTFHDAGIDTSDGVDDQDWFSFDAIAGEAV